MIKFSFATANLFSLNMGFKKITNDQQKRKYIFEKNFNVQILLFFKYELTFYKIISGIKCPNSESNWIHCSGNLFIMQFGHLAPQII